MFSATKIPNGISIARMITENAIWRPKAFHIRSDSIISRNQSRPAQKNWLFPKVSCTE